MFETVTVDQALKRGWQTVNLPVIIIIIGVIGLSTFLGVQELIPGWAIGAGIALAFVLAWLYWSVMITRWRLWAFDNVRNVHQLKKRAIKKQLIWPDGSFFERAEIRNADQKQQWLTLQDKFKVKDIFTDDLTVADETIIRYSKVKAGGLLAVGLLCCGLFGWMFKGGDRDFITYIIAAAGVIMMVMGYRHLQNREPQLILSNKGVQDADGVFYNWGEITNEDTKVVQSGKSSTTYFNYDCPDGEKSLDINEYDISIAAFEKVLWIYRERYENKRNS